MGYTHYWYQDTKLDDEKFAAAALDIGKVIEATDVPLANGMGDEGTKPEVGSKRISFNGVDEDGHETFYAEPEVEKQSYLDPNDPMAFNFCKTARKPYDEVVTASLAVLKHHLGSSVRVSSDGYFSEWEAGLALAKQATGLDLSSLMQEELEREE
jgi:hypothetical protein